MLRGVTGISRKSAFALGIFRAILGRQTSDGSEGVACAAAVTVRCGILGVNGAAVDADTDRQEAIAMAY